MKYHNILNEIVSKNAFTTDNWLYHIYNQYYVLVYLDNKEGFEQYFFRSNRRMVQMWASAHRDVGLFRRECAESGENGSYHSVSFEKILEDAPKENQDILLFNLNEFLDSQHELSIKK